jgi:hypothetical protein
LITCKPEGTPHALNTALVARHPHTHHYPDRIIHALVSETGGSLHGTARHDIANLPEAAAA